MIVIRIYEGKVLDVYHDDKVSTAYAVVNFDEAKGPDAKDRDIKHTAAGDAVITGIDTSHYDPQFVRTIIKEVE